MRGRRSGAAERVAVEWIAVGLAVGVLLGGCAPSTPPSAPDPAETRQAPEPSASSGGPAVVIRSDRLVVLGETGTESAQIPYSTDAATATAQLTAALGDDPSTTSVTDDPCFPLLDERGWGGLHLWTSPDGVIRPADAQFFVTADDEETSTGFPIRITSGQTVGATQDEVLAANLGAPSFGTDDAIDLHYDVASGAADGDPDQYWGAIAQLEDGELRSIGAPVYYQREC